MKTKGGGRGYQYGAGEADVDGDAGPGRDGGDDLAPGRLAGFRRELYRCLGRRRDALFELGDGVLCRPGRVHMLAELSLEPECRRGHGAVYDAISCGEVRVARLRRALAGLPLPAWPDGRIRLGVDVSPWLRPEAATSAGRLFCHVYGRGKGSAQMIPGWPYSVIAALEPGRTSWTAVLDAVRLQPDDDETGVTAGQVRDVVGRLIAAGHWRADDPAILVVFDAGYDVTRLAWLLADLPVEVLGRLRADRVMQLPAPPRRPGTMGRPRKHGGELALADPATWPDPQVTTSTPTSRYGMAVAAAWDRVPPRLTHRAAWLDHDGDLPVLEGTLIRLQVDRLPGDRDPKPVSLWFSRVFHRLEHRVRGHVLICMLAAYLTWHLRQAWAPLTCTDEEPPIQANPVAPARRSASAGAKASRQHDNDGRPYLSFPGLLAHLGTLTRNELRFAGTPAAVPVLTEPTTRQRQAFDLIEP